MGIKPGWALLLLPLLTGMRDPFVPPEDPCPLAPLTLMRYAGYIESGPRQIGFLRDENGKWRRVARDEAIDLRWRIAGIAAESLTLALGAECELAQWQIIKGELKSDNKDKPAGVADAPAAGAQ